MEKLLPLPGVTSKISCVCFQVLEFCTNNLCKDGHLVVSIQSNNNKQSISPTGIESIKRAVEIFSIVDPEKLLRNEVEKGFSLIGKEENKLPNGKSIKTFHFVRQ